MYFDFPTNFVWNIFILRGIKRSVIVNVQRSSYNVLVLLSGFNEISIFTADFQKFLKYNITWSLFSGNREHLRNFRCLHFCLETVHTHLLADLRPSDVAVAAFLFYLPSYCYEMYRFLLQCVNPVSHTVFLQTAKYFRSYIVSKVFQQASATRTCIFYDKSSCF